MRWPASSSSGTGASAGKLLAGIAAAQLAGEDFLTGLDRQRADPAGQQVTPVPGLSSTTAAGLARRITPGQWLAVETGLAAVTGRTRTCCPRSGRRRWPAGRSRSTWTPRMWRSTAGRSGAWPITTRASGSGGRTWRLGLRPRSCWPLTWATAPMTRARPRRICCAARWWLARGGAGFGPVAMRADAGYFAGALARAAHDERISFAIGAKRIAPLWRLLAGIAEDDWHDAIDMDGAQVAVAEYCPVARQHPAADPPGPAGTWSRSPPTRGPGGAVPCTRTSGPCRSPDWRSSRPSTPTASS